MLEHGVLEHGMDVAEVRQFPVSEFEERAERLRVIMRQRGADVMLVDDIEPLAYFTGYERSVSFYRAAFIPLQGEPFMVLRSLDIVPFRECAWFSEAVGYQDTDDAVAVVASELARRGYGAANIGIDYGSHAMSVSSFRKLEQLLPGARFIDMTAVPWEARLIKSDLELEHIGRAAYIADTTMSEIRGLARAGVSSRDMSAHAAGRYVQLGSSPGYVGPITYGKGWGFLHGFLSETPMVPGDILHVELVPKFRGYSARLMRSVVIGQATNEQKAAAAEIVRLQDEQFAAMRPGAVASDVDAILRTGLLRAGLRDSYDNITGYTIGFYSQQPIRSSDFTRVFSPSSKWKLQSGMTFHMYTSAQGLAFSESVVVTPEGGRRFSKLERRLFESGPRG
ncbi:M24 family metallopeptidase [Achromobacter aloeverae]|nr:Xaa-Pro peptidase family protein [Achromobacter aloeverae]